MRYALLRGLPVAEPAAAAGAGGTVRLWIGRRVFEGREVLVELTPTGPAEAGGFSLRAAVADARGRSSAGGSVRSDTPLLVTAAVGPEVDLATPGLRRGRPPGGAPDALLRALHGERAAKDAGAPANMAAAASATERARAAERAAEVSAQREALLATPAPAEPAAAGRLARDAAAEADAEAARPTVDPGVLPAEGVVSYFAPRITADPARPAAAPPFSCRAVSGSSTKTSASRPPGW